MAFKKNPLVDNEFQSKALEQKELTCLLQILMEKERAGNNLISVIHTFTCPFNWYELNIYHVLDTMLDIVFPKMMETLFEPGSGDRHVCQKLQCHVVGTL